MSAWRDSTTLGALMTHFFIETIAAADLLGVHVSGQLAVAAGKVPARQFLGETRRAGAQ